MASTLNALLLVTIFLCHQLIFIKVSIFKRITTHLIIEKKFSIFDSSINIRRISVVTSYYIVNSLYFRNVGHRLILIHRHGIDEDSHTSFQCIYLFTMYHNCMINIYVLEKETTTNHTLNAFLQIKLHY